MCRRFASKAMGSSFGNSEQRLERRGHTAGTAARNMPNGTFSGESKAGNPGNRGGNEEEAEGSDSLSLLAIDRLFDFNPRAIDMEAVLRDPQ
ncbi:unnamed protein product [Lampetra fluviatilis]